MVLISSAKRVILASILALVCWPATRAAATSIYAIPDKGPAQYALLRDRGLDVIGREYGRLLVVAEFADETYLARFGAPPRIRLTEPEPSTVRAKDLGGVYSGYHTYVETLAEVQFLAATYPTLCEASTLGTSFEGRDIPVLRITDLSAPKTNGGRPEVLIFGNLHARELMSVEIPLKFARYLLENYGVDAGVKGLVDARELYVVPMMNPDGHVYVENNNFLPWFIWWRKNRRPNGDGSFGVDLNRNFSYQWGFDDLGSSSTPDDIDYRGPSALSENETQDLAAFCAGHEFQLALSYHSFGEQLLYPWQYAPAYTVDHELFSELGRRLTAENGYQVGIPAEGVTYVANGTSEDWAYGESMTRNSILSFTVEVNTIDEGGFGPEDSYIQPTFDLLLPMNLRLLELADEPRRVLGPVAPVLDPTPSVVGSALTLSWSGNISSDPNPALAYTVEEFRDIEPWIDEAEEDLGLWIIDGFALSDTAYTGSGSYYSGTGNDLYRSITTSVPYSVTASSQDFACHIRYDMEDGQDYAYVMVSTDGGLIWSPVPGSVTTDDNPYGLNRGHGITGSTQQAWIAANFDLSAYMGQTVALRVAYITDGSGISDGLWLDALTPVPSAANRRIVATDHPDSSIEISLSQIATYAYRARGVDQEGDVGHWSNLISVAVDPVTAVGSPGELTSHLAGNYPNPFNPRTWVDFTLGQKRGVGAQRVVIEIYDLSGRRVRTLLDEARKPGVYRELFDGTDDLGHELASGIYLARLLTDGVAVGARKMALLR